jgi:glycosyltransferase involved in cell wall biosynthesis
MCCNDFCFDNKGDRYMDNDRGIIKISFIIPAYNVEKYIERCIHSILALKTCNVEIIVVNDGSTDDTINICNGICDSRLKVYTKQNGGVSLARNYGIELATGDYLTFVDGDDYLLTSEYDSIISRLKPMSDVIMFGYCINQDGIAQNMTPCLQEGIYDYENGGMILARRMLDPYFAKRYKAKYIGGKVYQYIIKREILTYNTGVRFPKNVHYAEDMLFCVSMLERAENLQVIDVIGYCYIVYNGSASHKFRKDYWEELLDVYKNIAEMQILEEHSLARLYFRYVKESIAHYTFWCKDFRDLKEYLVKILGIDELHTCYDNLEFNDWTIYERFANWLIIHKKYTMLAQVERLKFIIKNE